MHLFLWILLGLLGSAIFIALMVTLIHGKNPVRRLAGSGIQGLCALAAVNVAGAFTGISLGLGVFTGVYCLFLGIPGVLSLLVLKLIFGV